jgi:hypothetical protein
MTGKLSNVTGPDGARELGALLAGLPFTAGAALIEVGYRHAVEALARSQLGSRFVT